MTATGYLLDTNVVSELAKPEPDQALARWIRPLVARQMFLSAITIGELSRGIARLPLGQRRDRLRAWLANDLEARFQGRILPFDDVAARIWGEIMGSGDRRGRPRSALDMQIAAIAVAHGLAVVTRNVSDFAGLAVAVEDPWLAR